MRGDMNKLDASPPTYTLAPMPHSDPSTSSASAQHPEPVNRLIVLFPASETDTPDLEHRIWEIARSLHLNVLFLSVTNDFDEEAQLRRKLINMAAVIKDPNVSTDIMIEHGNDWLRQVKRVWMEGDIVACYAGQKVGLMRRSLDQVLRSNLKTTIYLLSDYQPAQPGSTFMSQITFWLGSTAIIGGFLLADIKIIQLPQDWAHSTLIYACLAAEVAIIWLWNSLFT
jgi:hypothetical protein